MCTPRHHAKLLAGGEGCGSLSALYAKNPNAYVMKNFMHGQERWN
jgi:hypothetical protein